MLYAAHAAYQTTTNKLDSYSSSMTRFLPGDSPAQQVPKDPISNPNVRLKLQDTSPGILTLHAGAQS